MPQPTVRFRDPDTGKEVGPEVRPSAGQGRQFVEFGPAVTALQGDERQQAAGLKHLAAEQRAGRIVAFPHIAGPAAPDAPPAVADVAPAPRAPRKRAPAGADADTKIG